MGGEIDDEKCGKGATPGVSPGYGSPDDALCLVVNAPITERRSDLLERLGVAAVLLNEADGIVALNPSAARLVAG